MPPASFDENHTRLKYLPVARVNHINMRLETVASFDNARTRLKYPARDSCKSYQDMPMASFDNANTRMLV